MAEAAGPSTVAPGVDTKSDDEHFVDTHQSELIKRVSNIQPILDELLCRNVIQQEGYDKIKTLPTAEEKMRELISGPLKSSGVQGKDIFYEILIENQPLLIQDLKRIDAEVETMSTKKRLCETLNDLSSEELEKFKSLIELVSLFSIRKLKMKDTRDITELMVETYSITHCLWLTRYVLETMNRTDLVQRLIDTSPEKQRPSLMQRVEMMESVIELLLEALKDLSKAELEMFKNTLHPVQQGPPSFQLMQQKAKYIPLTLLNIADMQGTVCLMVQSYGQQSVEMTKESLKMMKRTDLVQRLSDSSSRPKKELSVDKHRSSLIKKAATMGAVKELLLETLYDLSYEEQKNFTWFLQFTFFQMSLPQIYWSGLQKEDMAESLVDVMVEKYGQKSVEVIREVLMDMNRTDLVQRLSETSSGLEAAVGSSGEVFGVNTTEEEKHSEYQHWPVLIQKVEMMESVIELLSEALKDLSKAELERFKSTLHPVYKGLHSSVKWVQQKAKYIPFYLLDKADMQDTVCLMVESCGQQSVEMTKEILKMMKRTYLVQRLSDSSSRPTKQHQSAMIKKAATMGAVKELLLETLNDLSYEEQKNFTWFLQFTFFQMSLPQIYWRKLQMKDMTESLVDLMVKEYGQKSVEVIREVLMDMNQTDLVQRLSETSSRPKAAARSSAEVFGVNTTEEEKQSVEEDRPALIQKVASMESVIELLLETLKDLSNAELEKFKHALLRQIYIMYSSNSTIMLQTQTTHLLDTVFIIVLNYSEQSVEMIRDILKTMKRTDLVKRLSDRSSGSKKKHSADEHRSALIHKVATVAAVQQLLLETLNNLSDTELEKFRNILWSTVSQKNLTNISSMWSSKAGRADIVNQMVHTYGQQSVELTREVLMEMKRTDPVQRLSKPSSVLTDYNPLSPSEKHSVGLLSQRSKETGPSRSTEHEDFGSAMVVTGSAVQQLLLETLNNLSDMELWKFKNILRSTVSLKKLPNISPMWSYGADLVNQMVHIYGQQSVELTREVLMDMKRTDLVQRLSKPSSVLKEKHSVGKHPSVSSEREVSVRMLHQKLLEMLKDFSPADLEEFKDVLLYTKMKKGFPRILRHRMETADRVQTVKLMVELYGQRSEEVIREVFNKMNRRDLVQRLSDISSGSEAAESLTGPCYDATVSDKPSVDEHLSELMQKGAKITTDRERLLNVLEHLKQEEFEKFKWFLQDSDILTGLPRIPHHRLEKGNMLDVVDLMLQTYGQQSVELTKKVLMGMKRTDLVQMWSKPSSGHKGPSRSLEHEDFGSAMQDSSDWTKLEPEVNSTDADEAPTYSLQSEAGNFECSVSGLRWVCKEKVSLKYQFCRWEEPVERMEIISYMPAGPLMNITVTAGKLHEAYLPHWICVDNNPELRDKFAVLHITDCGEVVEKVAEVTSSHVKLSEPHFSPLMVLVKLGCSVDINCYMLIYKTNKAFLTLHVYLIPCDPGLKEELDNRQSTKGYQMIEKPHPETPLRMNDYFILTAGLDGVEIDPEKLMLRYNRYPNFFEVHIKNADTDFKLTLRRENEHEPVRTCKIRKDDYQSAAHVQDAAPADQPSVLPPPTQLSAAEQGEDEHFVDKHQVQLTDRVNNIAPILDELLVKRVIQQEKYKKIRALQTPQEKMRELYSGPIQASRACKDIFYKILKEREPRLIDDLKEKK